MSYDPYRTNMLPDMGNQFPITDELPAVGGGPAGPRSRFFLKLLAVLLVAAIAAVAAILVIDNQRSDQVATGDADPTPTAAPDAPGQTPGPTAGTEFERGEPGFWRVIDVAEGLNVRSGPGTGNDVIGVLAADSRHILGTGQTATADGGEWTEVRFDAADRVGWVSSRFLGADSAPSEDEPDEPEEPEEPTPEPTPEPSGSVSVVCFRSDGEPLRIARIEFTDRTEITGRLRSIGAESTTDQTLSGTLDNGRAEITLTDVDSNARSRQTWTFNPANVDLGGGRTLDVVGCDGIAGDLG